MVTSTSQKAATAVAGEAAKTVANWFGGMANVFDTEGSPGLVRLDLFEM